MVEVFRLQTRKQAADKALLADLAERLSLFPDEIQEPMPSKVLMAFNTASSWLNQQAREPSERRWSGGYCMLSVQQTEFVWQKIRELPGKERPVLVRDVFMFMMLNLRHDTGEMMLSRQEFAEKVGVNPIDISRAMSTLERIGVVRRDRTHKYGYQRGVVTYIVNAHVGWKGTLDTRQAEALKAEKPSLKVVEGTQAKPTKRKARAVEAVQP